MGVTRWSFVQNTTTEMRTRQCQLTSWGTTTDTEKNASFVEQTKRWDILIFGRLSTRGRRSWKQRQELEHSSTSCPRVACPQLTHRRTSYNSLRMLPRLWWATRDAIMVRSSWKHYHIFGWSEFLEIVSDRSSLGNVEDNTVSFEKSSLWTMAPRPMSDSHIESPRIMGMSSTRTTSKWCLEMTSWRSWDMLMRRPKSAVTWSRCGLAC